MEDVEVENSFSYAESLPMEILTIIFQYLSYQERKTCRLVSKRWFTACNIFTPSEKIVGLGIYTAREILDSLTYTLRPCLNLEFHFTKFEDYPISFWIECGAKIRSLVFIDCDMNDETVANVITYCENLRHLSFKFITWVPQDGKTFCSVDMLNILIQSGLVREQLTSMDVIVSGMFRNRWVSNEVMERLFFLFPNITKFEFFCDYLEPGQSTSKFVLPCIFNKIMSSNGIEKLRLHGDQEKILSSALNLRSLKEIRIDSMKASHTKLVDFICAQEQLTTLDCSVRLEAYMSFLNRILTSCRRLRNLKLQLFGSGLVKMDALLFRTLVLSNLETLHIACDFLAVSCNSNDLPTNRTVWYLCIETTRRTDPPSQILFLEKFRGLKHLTLCELTDPVLQTIWRCHPNLTSLRLWHCEYTSHYGFTGNKRQPGDQKETYSIKALERLQYLEVKASRVMWNVAAEVVFCECISPNLRYLSLDLTIPPSTQSTFALNELLQRTSQLEAISLSVKVSKISPAWWLKLCSQAKKLRYICMAQKDFVKFTTFEMMFERCPSLRAVMNKSPLGQYVYCDIIRKKLMMKSPLYTFPITAGKVDAFVVDWLQL